MTRILGLDIGDRRIGVAVSDETRLIASPLCVIKSVGWGPDSREIARLMAQQGADMVVSGLPYNMDGSLGFQARKILDFLEVLKKSGIQVELIDERLTTVAAQRALIEGGMRREDRRDHVDKVAAAVILQTWLDRQRNNLTEEKDSMADEKTNLPGDSWDEEETADEMPDIIELTDENDETTRFEYVTTLDHEGELYIALLPLEDGQDEADDEDAEVVFLKIEQDENGEDMYVSVDDEDVINALFEKLTKLMEEEE